MTNVIEPIAQIQPRVLGSWRSLLACWSVLTRESMHVGREGGHKGVSCRLHWSARSSNGLITSVSGMPITRLSPVRRRQRPRVPLATLLNNLEYKTIALADADPACGKLAARSIIETTASLAGEDAASGKVAVLDIVEPATLAAEDPACSKLAVCDGDPASNVCLLYTSPSPRD